MKLISTLLFIFKSIFWGALIGLSFLFFVPNSKLPFNWQVANDMYNFYLEEKAAREVELKEDKLTVETFSFADAVKKASPSVVSINAFKRRLRSDDRLPSDQKVLDTGVGIGSGIIISSQGHIVTNYHVVKDAIGVSVNLDDGRKKVVSLVGYDQETDLAVLKVDLDGLIPAEFDSSEDLEPGDIVMAIGSPFGRDQSVSLGIVSALVFIPVSSRIQIQTDAAINEGNSGGPLINTEGKVVGLSQITLSSAGGGQTGINYAIPVNSVKKIVEEIINYGKVKRNWLGINGVELLESIHRANFPDVPFGEGIFVDSVETDSPADKAGLQHQDYIMKFNGQDVNGMSSFYQIFHKVPIGASVEVEFYRNGKMMKTQIDLKEK